MKTPVVLETTFGEYTLTEQLGEGGAGRVYGGTDAAGTRVAIKVLINTSTVCVRPAPRCGDLTVA